MLNMWVQINKNVVLKMYEKQWTNAYTVIAEMEIKIANVENTQKVRTHLEG